MKRRYKIYECGICGCYHPWEFNGDCRDDANRINDPDEYATKLGVSGFDVDVLSWEDREAADAEEYPEVTAKLERLLNS